jgi:hypothetical protein
MEYSNYVEFCKTEVEVNILKLLSTGKKQTVVARDLGIHRDTVRRTLDRIKSRASMQGFSPEHGMTHKVPQEYYVKGTSTLYDADGQKKMEWVKTNAKAMSMIEIVQGVVDSLQESVHAKFEPVKLKSNPEKLHADYLTVLPIGDAHAGLMSWERETGENYDLKIWEKDIITAYDYLIDRSMNTRECVLVNLGDYLHVDDSTNSTPRSGNQLDVDSRFHKIFDVAVQSLVYVAKRALEKFEKVTLINVTGNHDLMSSYALSMVLKSYFHNEPRIDVRAEPKTFHYFEFGKVMLMATHGDTCKIDQMTGVAANDECEMWGRTRHRYALTGHIHHTSKKEINGMVIESFRSLVAKDAWHFSSGYRAGRDMNLITYHKNFGEVGRVVANLDLIKSLQDEQ